MIATDQQTIKEILESTKHIYYANRDQDGLAYDLHYLTLHDDKLINAEFTTWKPITDIEKIIYNQKLDICEVFWNE